jgi:small subunit ribosomal protein S6
MTLPAPTYDLVLLLDMQSEPEARAKIVADTRASIEAQGELLRHDEWGERALTYPIEKKASAEYHLFQFHVGEVELLGSLDRTLRITDGLLRFRIVKLAPGVPEAPNMGAASRPEGESAPVSAPSEPAATSEPEPAPDAEVAPAIEPEPAPAAEAAPAIEPEPAEAPEAEAEAAPVST